MFLTKIAAMNTANLLLYIKPSSKFYYMGVFVVAAIIGVIGYAIILNLNVKKKR